MQRLSLLVVLLAPASVVAQVETFPVVVPTGAATTEGQTSTALPFGSSLARHVLYAYGGDAAGYVAPIRIGAIELRPDGTTPGGAAAGSYSFSLDCSTGANAPKALSTNFAANHGADRSRVFSGALTVPAPALGSAPNAFSLRIPFRTPFEWDPRNGPLVLDFAYNAAKPAFGAWDAEAAPNDVGGLAATGASATTATSVLTSAPVLRLLTAADVAPSAFANVEAATNTSFPWNRPAGSEMRTLTLYEASVMPSPARRLITALAWRTDAGAAFSGRSYDVKISMSTSPATVATLSSTFAANHGSDLTVVFDGTLAAGPTPANASLDDFDLFCELQRPFEYDPANGSLIVDIQLRGSTGATGASFDCASQTGLPAARVSDSTSATSTTGTSLQRGIALVMAIRSVPVPVVPAALANAVSQVAANNTSFPWSAAPCRTLGMVSAAAAGITEPTFVRHLKFRPAGTTFGPTTWTCTIDLSNPSNTPATISPTFDANHGSNRLRVFDGQFSTPFGQRLATDPRLPIEVKLQRPFLWDPALHPYLSVDVVVSARAGPPIAIETTSGLSIDNARLTSSSPTATTGTTQQLAFVVQIGGERANGLAVNYGAGCAGVNGVPICTTVGVPCLPNRDFAIRVRNAPGNAAAFLLLGQSAASLPINGAPGCVLLHGFQFGIFGALVTDPAGDGSLPLPLLPVPSFDGFTFRSQWIVLDPTANALGATTSDAQALTMAFF